MKSKLTWIMAVAVIATGCSAQATTSPTKAPTPSVLVAIAPTPSPTRVPSPTPSVQVLYAVGVPIPASQKGTGAETVEITDVKQVASYKGDSVSNKPYPKGYVFIQLKVTYIAVSAYAEYSPVDWRVFCGDTTEIDASIINDGPTPPLDHFGLLGADGDQMVGYLVFDVPAKGECRLGWRDQSTDPSEPNVFEVIIRAA